MSDHNGKAKMGSLQTPSAGDGGQAAISLAEQLPLSSTATSASAAFARSLLLFMGLMFRRPSKLFRPNRVDTWGGLRELAISANQSFSPTFIRDILKRRGGPLAVTLTLLPPLAINTTLGFLLFTSHSIFSLALARLPVFHRTLPASTGISTSSSGVTDDNRSAMQYRKRLDPNDDAANVQEQEYEEHHITLQTLLQGPSFVPRHPTVVSAIAGAGAGVLQGMAFTPIENVVRFIHQSTTSLTSITARFLHLSFPNIPNSTTGPSAASPWDALKNLFSSDAWKKSPSWWTGWRWAVARDALSYSCFFAAFDITRRVGLRVKALFGGESLKEWHNLFVLDLPSIHPAKPVPDNNQETPTIARIAQATTIVAGGVSASILAEVVGRPFRTCQRIMQKSKLGLESNLSLPNAFVSRQSVIGNTSGINGMRGRTSHPIMEVYKKQGIRPFMQSETWSPSSSPVLNEQGNALKRMARRVGWRLVGVGPWGFGFLVWAWVGGEV